jgi:hypothetical protein
VPQSAPPLNGSPSPSQSRPLFGFGEPATGEEPAGLPSSSLPHLESSSPSLEDLEPASADEWHELEDELEDLDGTRSTASSSEGVPNPLNAEGLRDVFRGGVIIAGDQAHQFLAKSEGAREVGLYLTDEEDAANIGDPLARVAARHQGVGKVNPDTADLLAAMVGLTRYATKQISRAHSTTGAPPSRPRKR